MRNSESVRKTMLSDILNYLFNDFSSFFVFVQLWCSKLASGGFFLNNLSTLASHIGFRRFFFQQFVSFGVPYLPSVFFFETICQLWRPILASGCFFNNLATFVYAHFFFGLFLYFDHIFRPRNRMNQKNDADS